METIETNQVIDKMGELLHAQIEELKKLRTQNDEIVWNSDTKAAKETGLGKAYFERIRHRLPHIIIKDEQTGYETVVYPKQAVKRWLDEHTEFYKR